MTLTIEVIDIQLQQQQYDEEQPQRQQHYEVRHHQKVDQRIE